MAKILLIDDSKALLSHIKRMLESGGHEVIATTSGKLAIEQLPDLPVDLVVTDLYMPSPDGFEVVSAVRALPRTIPLIVMSSNTLACGIFRDTQALGATATLHKPFEREKLLTTVRVVLEGNGAALPENTTGAILATG